MLEKSFTFLSISLAFTFAFAEPDWAQTVYVPNQTHIWPLDSPQTYPGNSSQEHAIFGTLGEFRTNGGNHFHGGGDIPATNGTDFFSVYGDYDYVIESVQHRIGIRRWFVVTGSNWNEWGDGNGDQWFTHRYLHVDPFVHVDPDDDIHETDKIVNDLTLTERTPDPNWPGHYKYPRHLLIGEVEDYGTPGPSGDHLHIEEVCYDGIPGNDATDGYFNYNPLFLLAPFEDDDNHDPVIEEVLLYPQGSNIPITDGSGTKDDPYRVPSGTTQLDIRVHAHDVIDDHAGGTRNVAPFVVYYNIYDEEGHQIGGGSYAHYYKFWLIGPAPSDRGTGEVTQGVGWIYDTNVSTSSEYYYWATNNYSAIDGGTDGFLNISQLQAGTKYIAGVYIVDTNIENNYDAKVVWFTRVPTGVGDVFT